MIERLQPIFAKPKARSGRFYIRDNFLRSWLAALALPAASVSFRPLDQLVREADSRLVSAEGHGFERLVAHLYAERSRKGLEGFRLTRHVHGYWDRKGTEIDMVAVDETDRIVRFASCKRDAERLIQDLDSFEGHIGRFLEGTPRFQGWRIEKAAITPRHTPQTRRAAEHRGWLSQDLVDLTHGL
jgi:hypothetical protein